MALCAALHGVAQITAGSEFCAYKLEIAAQIFQNVVCFIRHFESATRKGGLKCLESAALRTRRVQDLRCGNQVEWFVHEAVVNLPDQPGQSHAFRLILVCLGIALFFCPATHLRKHKAIVFAFVLFWIRKVVLVHDSAPAAYVRHGH